MGQRLNIEIYDGGDQLVHANCYYHWSAYTLSALEQIKDIIKQYNKIKNDKELRKDPLLFAYKLLSIDQETYDIDEDDKYDENGKYKFKSVIRPAGLCDQSFKLMSLLFPKEEFAKGVDRNVGLISIHPKDVLMTRRWEEGRVDLYLDSETFYFDLYWVESKEELMEYNNMTEADIEKIPPFPEDINLGGEISFNDIDKLIEIISDEYHIYKTDDGYINWIY